MEPEISWQQVFRRSYAENMEKLGQPNCIAESTEMLDKAKHSASYVLASMKNFAGNECASEMDGVALLDAKSQAMLTCIADFARVIIDKNWSQSAEASRLSDELRSVLARIGPVKNQAVSECQTTGSTTNGSVGGSDAAVGGPDAAADGSSSAEDRENGFMDVAAGGGPRDDLKQKVKDGGSDGSVERRKVSDEPKGRRQHCPVKRKNRLRERDSKSHKSKKDFSTRSSVTGSDRHGPKCL